jgi:hypothetical protein
MIFILRYSHCPYCESVVKGQKRDMYCWQTGNRLASQELVGRKQLTAPGQKFSKSSILTKEHGNTALYVKLTAVRKNELPV